MKCSRSGQLCFEICLNDLIFSLEFLGRNTYQDGVNFIRQKFVGLNRNPSRKTVYTHVTCATDTHNIQYVFQSCTEIIISEHLRDAGLVWVFMSTFFLLISVSIYLPLSLTVSPSLYPLPLTLKSFPHLCVKDFSLSYAVSFPMFPRCFPLSIFVCCTTINLLLGYPFYLYWKSVILCDSPIVWLMFHLISCIYFLWLCLLCRNYEDNQSCLNTKSARNE